MIPSLYKRLTELEELARKASERLKELEIENRRLSAENALLLAEQKKAQQSVSRYRILSDHQERVKKRLLRLREKLLKLETV